MISSKLALLYSVLLAAPGLSAAARSDFPHKLDNTKRMATHQHKARTCKAPAGGDKADGPFTILAGTYNAALLTFSFDPSGKLALAANTSIASDPWNDPAPSWLEPHPNDPNTVILIDESEAGRSLTAHVDKAALAGGNEKGITFVDDISTQGNGPAHVGHTADGKWAIAANYGGGSAIALPLADANDKGEVAFDKDLAAKQTLFQFEGKGPVADRQDTPHAHMAIENGATKSVFIPDLGTDKLHEIRLDTSTNVWNLVGAIEVDAGSGPRHLRFSEDGKTGYLITEITNTVVTFTITPPEDLEDPKAASKFEKKDEKSILPPDAKPIEGLPLGGGEIHVVDGFVYASNRNEDHPEGDAIAIFAISADDPTSLGEPQFVRSGGSHIRGMEFDSTGTYVAVGNQNSASVVIFQKGEDGGLTKAADLDLAEGTQVNTFLWL